MNEIKLVCCIGVSRHEHFCVAFLEHFIQHYLGLGIKPENFLLTLHADAMDQDIERVERLLSRFEIQTKKYLVEKYDCYRFYESNFELMANCGVDDWIVLVDFDELIEFPSLLPLFVEELTTKNLNCAFGYMVDRVSQTGELVEIKAGSPIWDQFPRQLAITRDIVKGFDQKTCIFKNYIQPNMGHHWVNNPDVLREYDHPLKVHHFKWDSTLIKKLGPRLVQFRSNKERYFWHEEVDNLLRHIDGNRIRFESAGVYE